MAAADPQVRIETLERALHWAQLTIQKRDAEIQLLQERLRKQRIGFLGPASETLSGLQLELLTEEEPGATREEVEAESRREPISTGAAARAETASGPQESAARRRSDRLASQLRIPRRRNARDRLRLERSAGPGTA